MHRRAAFLVQLTVFVLLGLGPLAAQAPTDEALVARVDALAARFLSGPGAVGLSVAVARGDKVVLDKGYGLADLEHGVPATEATLFRIASVTKQYTAAAILKLVERGRIGLDDELTKHLDYPTQGRTVTIRQLLNHTSGIRNFTAIPPSCETQSSLLLAPAQVLEAFGTLPFEFEPGTGFAYSNTGYHLLGMLIEKVSGRSYAAFLQDELITPLGLARTRYDVASEIVPGRARGYRLLDGEPANAAFVNMTVPFASGGLMASAGDLVAWQLALVAGVVVSPASYAQMAAPGTLADGATTGYGFGLRLRELEGHHSIWHGGGIDGFNSVLAYYPQERLSVAVVSNSESVPSSLVAQLIAREALGIVPGIEDLTLPAAELEPLIGTYRIAEIGLDFTVTAAAGWLFFQGSGEPPVPVMAQGGGEFRATWDGSLHIRFDPPAEPGGKAPSFTFQQGGGTFKALRGP